MKGGGAIRKTGLFFILFLVIIMHYLNAWPKKSKTWMKYFWPLYHCRYLADRYRVVQLRPDLLYLAVFDGHGGSLCAEYCEEHFERHILHHLDREEDMLVVLDKSFHDVNRSFERWYTSKREHLGRASSSGSTATVGLLQVKLKILCSALPVVISTNFVFFE